MDHIHPESLSHKKVKWQLTPLDQQTESASVVSGQNGFHYWSLWTVLDALGLVIVLLAQGSILNYYIILFNDGDAGWYFLFFVDFIIMITFMFSIAFAWRFYQRKRLEKGRGYLASSTEDDKSKRVGKGFFSWAFPKPMGMLPLIYLCWIAYALILMFKMFLLILMEIPEQMVLRGTRNGAEILALTFAAAVFVFILWSEAHRNLEDEKQRQITKACMDDLISHTLFEIFDSVIFLDLILPENAAEVAFDREHISYALKLTILVIAALNFLIPSLGLYRLSRIDFGEKLNKMKIINEITGIPSTHGLNISMVYHSLRLFAINIPYLVIRVHMSVYIGKDMSIFMLKNVLGIWISLRTLIPEMKEWFHVRRIRHDYLKQVSRAANGHSAIKVDASDHEQEWEMPQLFNTKGGNEKLQPSNPVTVQESVMRSPLLTDESMDLPHELPEIGENTSLADVHSDVVEEHFRNELSKRF
ncbi:hypothetical protein HDE_10160 [Halotydeus destructor]|nr:hypothetical protein HDE_10160 [Halotydeus destructor]